MVHISPSKCRASGNIPGWRAKIPYVFQPKNQNIKQKQYCNEFNKDFKTWSTLKKKKKSKGKKRGKKKKKTEAPEGLAWQSSGFPAQGT